jgi:hypothetical protein
MWDQTKGDWVFILDGDELWPLNSLINTLEVVHKTNSAYIINKTLNMVGDIFHYQESKAGNYVIGKHTGHLTVRFHNLLHLRHAKYHRGYPDECLMHPSGVPIQHYLPDSMPLVESPYLHATHLNRTSLARPLTVAGHRKKYELGIKISEDYVFPACFYYPRPKLVPSPWVSRRLLFLFQATWQTPLKLIKRRLFKSPPLK